MTTNLNELAKHCHEKAREKGWYEEKREIGTLLMLIVSELSEALEADRKNKLAYKLNVDNAVYCLDNNAMRPFKDDFERHVKDTFEDEITDAFIRLLDICGYLNIDIDIHIKLKLAYNELRPKKHGKEY